MRNVYKILFFLSFLSVFVINGNAANVKVTDYEWGKGASFSPITSSSSLGHWVNYGIKVRYNVDNSDRMLKEGSQIILPVTTSGNYPININTRWYLARGYIKDIRNNIDYGTWEWKDTSSPGNLKATLTFTFTKNIENIQSNFNGAFDLIGVWEHTNWTGNSQVHEINTYISGINRKIYSAATTYWDGPATTDGNAHNFSCGVSVNAINTITEPSRYAHRIYNYPQEGFYARENERVSTWVNSPRPRNIVTSIGPTVNMPTTYYDGDMKISTALLHQSDIKDKFFTKVNQINGETWADFKNRVWSKKYQYGTYISETGFGFVANNGDFTNNGWRNGGTYSLSNSLTGGLSGLLSRELGYTLNQQQVNVLSTQLGNSGPLNGGIPWMRSNLRGEFVNYGETIPISCESELFFKNTRTGKEVTGRIQSENLLRSIVYPLQQEEQSSTVKIIDKDTSELKTNLNVVLKRKVGNNWVIYATTKTGDSGTANITNIIEEGTFKWEVPNIPTGYQSKIIYKSGDGTTLVNSNGEFIHEAGKDKSFITIELEKIKTQNVDFVVKDTLNDVIPGEVFNIKRNGAMIAEYPTNSRGEFKVNNMPIGAYSLTSKLTNRIGVTNFIVEEGKVNDLLVEAIFDTVDSVEVESNPSVNTTLAIGNNYMTTLDYVVKYKSKNGLSIQSKLKENYNDISVLLNGKELNTNNTLIDTLKREDSLIRANFSPKLEIRSKSNLKKKVINVDLVYTLSINL